MSDYSIDINADVGEGIGNENKLMPYLSSCNIACGGHTGNEKTMSEVALLADKNRVKIGAHPSYPDSEHFGRKRMDISCAALFTSVKGQVKDLMHVLYKHHLQLHHIKPHGALYNDAAKNKTVAEVIIEVMKGIQLPLRLYVPYGSVIADLAIKERIPITYEAFADRNYNNDLTLVSRSLLNAIITDPDDMFEHVYGMISKNKVKTISGIEVNIKADTYCIHGDNPNAVALLKALSNKLKTKGVTIQ